MSKAKASAKGKKSPEKSKDKSAVDDLTQKLAESITEAEALKRELEFRSETISRLKKQNAELKAQVASLETTVEDRTQDKVDLTSDMNRQYKVMQNDMSGKTIYMEAQLIETKSKLAIATETLQRNEIEYKRTVTEKDTIIEEQYTRINCMAAEFESMLSETLDKMAKKLEAASQRWRDDITLTEANQRRLSEFLNGKTDL